MARVVLVTFDRAQGLDVIGPADVFAMAGYEVVVAARGARRIEATNGVSIHTRDLLSIKPRRSDTVLVAGGREDGIRSAVRDRALITWVASAEKRVKRIGSVCTGAFVLAQAGILDGKTAATHWLGCRQLAQFRPRVTVDENAIFVRDGRVWTSAGVTTGIDMALAIVEDDHDATVADAIAARLVLYARRPGFQSQFSDALVAQRDASAPLATTLAWARANLKGPLSSARLARRAGMSLRTFHRRCVDQLGTTPARLIESLRVEHARTLLTTTSLGTKTVAERSGFGTPGRMARVFKRAVGVAPREYALLHRRRSTNP